MPDIVNCESLAMVEEDRTLDSDSAKVAEEWKKLIDSNGVLQHHMHMHLNLKKLSNEFVAAVIEILESSSIPKHIQFNDIKLKHRRQMISSLAPHLDPEIREDKDFLMFELRKIFNKWIGDEDGEFVIEKIKSVQWFQPWNCMVYICKFVGHEKCTKQKLVDIQHLQIYKDFCDSQDPPLDYVLGAVKKKKSRYIPNGNKRGRPKKQRVEDPQPQLAQPSIDDDFGEIDHENDESADDSHEVPLQNLGDIEMTSANVTGYLCSRSTTTVEATDGDSFCDFCLFNGYDPNDELVKGRYEFEREV